MRVAFKWSLGQDLVKFQSYVQFLTRSPVGIRRGRTLT